MRRVDGHVLRRLLDVETEGHLCALGEGRWMKSLRD